MQRDSTCLILSATISTYWRKTTLASDMWTRTNRECVKSITIHPTNEIAEEFNLVGVWGELIWSLLLSVFSLFFFLTTETHRHRVSLDSTFLIKILIKIIIRFLSNPCFKWQWSLSTNSQNLLICQAIISLFHCYRELILVILSIELFKIFHVAWQQIEFFHDYQINCRDCVWN